MDLRLNTVFTDLYWRSVRNSVQIQHRHQNLHRQAEDISFGPLSYSACFAVVSAEGTSIVLVQISIELLSYMFQFVADLFQSNLLFTSTHSCQKAGQVEIALSSLDLQTSYCQACVVFCSLFSEQKEVIYQADLDSPSKQLCYVEMGCLQVQIRKAKWVCYFERCLIYLAFLCFLHQFFGKSLHFKPQPPSQKAKTTM